MIANHEFFLLPIMSLQAVCYMHNAKFIITTFMEMATITSRVNLYCTSLNTGIGTKGAGGRGGTEPIVNIRGQSKIITCSKESQGTWIIRCLSCALRYPTMKCNWTNTVAGHHSSGYQQNWLTTSLYVHAVLHVHVEGLGGLKVDCGMYALNHFWFELCLS